jgi:hypothetical protein
MQINEEFRIQTGNGGTYRTFSRETFIALAHPSWPKSQEWTKLGNGRMGWAYTIGGNPEVIAVASAMEARK